MECRIEMKDSKKLTMTALFHLFELEKYLQTGKEIQGQRIVKLTGGLRGMESFGSVRKEYLNSGILYPERIWRVFGKEFTVDVYDEGNGWYQIIKVRKEK